MLDDQDAGEIARIEVQFGEARDESDLGLRVDERALDLEGAGGLIGQLAPQVGEIAGRGLEGFTRRAKLLSQAGEIQNADHDSISLNGT